MRSSSFVCVALALVAFGLCAPRVSAQPVLTEYIPADAVVYVSWAGTDGAGEAYTNSRFKDFLDGSQMPGRVGKVVGGFLTMAGSDDETVMLTGSVENALPAAVKRPWAFYVNGYTRDADTEELVPRLGFVISPGDGPEGEAAIAWVVQTFGDMADEGVQVIEHGDVLAVVSGDAFVDPDAPDAPAAFNTNAAFAATLKGLGDRPTLIGYADVDSGRRVLAEVIGLEEGEDDVRKLQGLFKALGVDGVKHIGMTGSFEQRDWVQRAFIEAPAPRRGLAALLEGGTIRDADITRVSAQTNWVRTLNLDPARVMGVIRDALTAAEATRELEDFEEGLAEAREALGFDIEKDLLAPAGERWAMFSEPAFGSIGGFYPGIVVTNELDDAAAVDASLTTFSDWFNTMMQNEGGGFSFVTMEFGEVAVHCLATPFASPSWAVHDGRLYVGAAAQPITTAEMSAAKASASRASRRPEGSGRTRVRLRSASASRPPSRSPPPR